jgi:phosphate uptake regulator
VFSIFKESDSLAEVESHLDQMLESCCRMFDLAAGSVFGEVAAEEVSEELWSLDKQVNRTERMVRRELLVHGAVKHAEIEQGLLLAYMSVAKDIERIGDYCKNIWDLAAAGVDLSGAADSELLRRHATETREVLGAGRTAFSSQDQKAVHGLIPRLEVNAAEHDDIVMGYVNSAEPGRIVVPRALYFRFLKRISSHLANVLSSVVMPLDRIDFYKESKATG